MVKKTKVRRRGIRKSPQTSPSSTLPQILQDMVLQSPHKDTLPSSSSSSSDSSLEDTKPQTTHLLPGKKQGKCPSTGQRTHLSKRASLGVTQTHNTLFSRQVLYQLSYNYYTRETFLLRPSQKQQYNTTQWHAQRCIIYTCVRKGLEQMSGHGQQHIPAAKPCGD